MRQLYYTLRTLMRGRSSTGIKLISLTLGLLIGILLFSQIAYELNYERCYPEADRLVQIRASITNMNYDDTVRFAARQAEETGWVLVQDTAWEGYETIPASIMQGYLTMANEAAASLGSTVPTHIFLQAGVGAMSGATRG